MNINPTGKNYHGMMKSEKFSKPIDMKGSGNSKKGAVKEQGPA
jgi:hypothetical protein